MRILLRLHSSISEFDLRSVERPTATLADLRDAAGRTDQPGADTDDADSTVLVDGRDLPCGTTIGDAGIMAGSFIDLTGDTQLPDTFQTETLGAGAPVTRLAVVGGVDAGTMFAIGPGTHSVGRDRHRAILLGAPTVSRHHADLLVDPSGQVALTDRSSTNGVRTADGFAPSTIAVSDDPITLGAVQLALRPLEGCPPPEREATPEGTILFNRPPRHHHRSGATRLSTPEPSRSSSGITPFSWAMVIAPLVIGLVMARLLNPMFAVFVVLSPVMMIASWFEQRRRAARQRRRGMGEFRRSLTRFEQDLDDACRHELRRRRTAVPDLAHLADRALTGDARLWERRPSHDDFLEVCIGSGPVVWPVPLDRAASELSPVVQAAVSARATLDDAPIVASLQPGTAIGITGDPGAATALARALVMQTAILHGPADLVLAVVVDPTDTDWSFTTWLPHTIDAEGLSASSLVPGDAAAIAELTRAIEDRSDPGRGGGNEFGRPADDPIAILTVIDARVPGCDHERVRQVVPSNPNDCRSAIVIATRGEDLPAACTTIVECLGPDGLASVDSPAAGTIVDGVLVNGMSVDRAQLTARALARYADPDREGKAGGLPRQVTVGHCLHGRAASAMAPADVRRRWSAHDGSTNLPVTLGQGPDAPLTLDLVADGPHMLIGGTTGAGKSELLRLLIISLAATIDPRQLNFVLIDYKGGSAFDACGQLPHVVGLVTDLDDRLGARALQSLEAELRHRERRLRDAGASDLAAFERCRRRNGSPAADAIPRLVVVIDEFATLASELPSFLDALVSIAQRGRSLGVHLVLATQRPHGAINDNIRTNTNIRVALRVLSIADSTDVIDTPDAAWISRDVPGRGLVRLGHDELRPFQGAYLSGPPAPSAGTATAPETKRVDLVAVDCFGRPAVHPPVDPPVGSAGLVASGASGVSRASDPEPSDLRLLAAAIDRACEDEAGRQPVRHPWLAPLGPLVRFDDLGSGGDPERSGGLAPVAIGIVDEAHAQRQSPWRWDPAAGNLLLYGMPGSGTTSALVTVAAALARDHSPDDLHLYVLDFGAGTLAPLVTMAHTGAVIGVDERPRQLRLARLLQDEVKARRSRRHEDRPAIVVLIDDAGAMRAAYDDLTGLRFLERFNRLMLDGPALGIHFVIAGDRPQAIAPALASATNQKLLLHLPDPYDYGLCGARLRPPPRLIPGRAFTVDGNEVQIAHIDGGDLATELARSVSGRPGGPRPGGPRPGGPRRAPTIGELPTYVPGDSLAVAVCTGPVWSLPFAIGDTDLGQRALLLHAGEHVAVSGPPRSGRTTLLRLLAVRAADTGVAVVVVSTQPDGWSESESAPVARPWSYVAGAVDLGAAIARRADQPTLIIVDDAELVDDPDNVLAALLTTPNPRLRVVAAARADRLRGAYGHWTRRLRESRIGVALRPDLDLDGDFWGVRFGSFDNTAWPSGRGVLVHDGSLELVQVAEP